MLNGAIGPQSAMREVLLAYPGAQRALFRRYHIGGCASCGFKPTETLEQVCERNGGLDVNEVLDQIRASHAQDEKILIEPKELAEWLKREKSMRLLDIRSREEFEAVHIEGAVLMSQPMMQEILAEFQQRQIQIKDIERGLIDFPAIIGGREVFLCWEQDEEDIEFWHDLDTGYAGREHL